MRARTVLIATAATTVALAVFVLGVRVGAAQAEMLQSTVKASLLVGELRALRSGKPETLLQTKELELDSEVLKFAQFQRMGLPLLLWPESAQFEHERYLSNVAAYRKTFPSVMPGVVQASPSTATDEMRHAAALVTSTTDEIVRRYAK